MSYHSDLDLAIKEKAKHNGWTNYATWRINLEIFDGSEVGSWSSSKEAYEVAQDLKYYVEDFFEQTAIDSKNKLVNVDLMSSYAHAFISEVNWYEIAENLLDSWKYGGENEAV